MRTRKLCASGVEVSELGFGGWAIGGNDHGNSLGVTDDDVSRAAIDAALEGGITFFDTADVYGHGKSERLIGERIAAAGARARVTIATKAGSDFRDPANIVRRCDPAYFRVALTASLERLRTDRVDLFQLHDPPLDAIRSPEVHDALRSLKDEGLARAVGMTFHTLEEGFAALDTRAFDVLQGAMSVAEQWVANRVVERAAGQRTGFIAREPLAQGFLSGRYLPDHPFVQGDFRNRMPSHHRIYLCAMADWMRKHFHEREGLHGGADGGRHPMRERTIAQIALQFVLAAPGVSTVIVSMKTPEQVKQNIAVTELPALTRKQLAWLREETPAAAPA